MPEVHEVNQIETLAGYRLLWKSLLLQTDGATFFHSLDWLEGCLDLLGSGRRLRVMIVSAAGRRIGILPLVVRTERTRLGPIRVLTYPLGHGAAFFGPIGPNPTATLLAGLKHVHSTRRDWDLLDLRGVDAAGLDRGRTPRAMQWAGFRPRRQGWTQTAVIRIRGSWQAYWQARPRPWRRRVNRRRRRLAERGRLTHVRHRPQGEACGDADPRWDLYDACLTLARQDRQEPGAALGHRDVRRHLRAVHSAAVKAGSLDLNLLLVGGEPAAFTYNCHYLGNVCTFGTGCHPALAAAEPQAVLQQMVLNDGCNRGDCCYDLGAGSAATESPWQTSAVTTYRYTHYPAMALRAQALRLKGWCRDRSVRR